MRNKILIFAAGLLLAACQEYPETADGNGDYDKACNLLRYASNISLQYNSHSTLPEKISGSVNGMAVINECTLGNDNSTYTIVRHSDRSLTLVLWAENTAALSEEFFNSDGTPIEGKQIQLVLSGRQNCTDAPAQMYQTTRVLKWQPVYSNSNKACNPSGYSAILTH